MMRRTMILAACGLAAACVSTAALARVDVGVYLGAPAPVYAPPPVIYQPPPVVYAPAPAYGYGYGYRGYHRPPPHWRGHGYHRGWDHHGGRHWR